MTLRYDRRSFLAITGGALAPRLLSEQSAQIRSQKATAWWLVIPRQTKRECVCWPMAGMRSMRSLSAALVAGVVAVARCGIGGYGGHMTIGLPNGKVTSIDFNSEAPAARGPICFRSMPRET